MNPRIITRIISHGIVNCPQVTMPPGITQDCYRYTVKSHGIGDIGANLRVTRSVDTPEVTILFTGGGRGIGFYSGDFTL